MTKSTNWRPWLIAAAGIAVVALVWPRRAASNSAGKVRGKVTISKSGQPKDEQSGVVVYLEGVPGTTASDKRVTKIRQKDLAFAPELTVIVKGTTIDFPNEDKVFHNVFSLSQVAKFDLGLYKSGDSRSVTFDRAGVVDLYCNIHPDMAAKIKVLDSGFYAVTGGDGSFSIDDVPPGTYPIVAWQAYGEPYRGEVTLSAGNAAVVNIALTEGPRTVRHLRKDGTPYGRYK